MASFALRQLPPSRPSLILNSMMPVRRALAAFLAVAFAATFAPARAHAQSGEDGWFEDANGTPQQLPTAAPQAPPGVPAPISPGAPGNPGTPGNPGVPAATEAPARPTQPESLAPSPLYDQGTAAPAAADAQDQDPRAVTAWNQYVDPYGTWVDDSRYGRVWIPNPSVVGSDFAPYSTGGHWATDENSDWVWVSDYPFGWVTFHYGRWVWIAGRGWAWIPGMKYAPAWVVWRVPTSSYAYVGWAPYPPSYVWFGFGVGWYPYWYGYAPIYPWVFCPSAYVYSAHVHTYIVHDHATVAYAAHYTRPYNVAAPHPVGAHMTPAVPHGPSPQAAHVPARAMPVERISSSALAARGSASVAMTSSMRNVGARGSVSSLGRSPMVPTGQRNLVRQSFSTQRPGMTPRADLRPQSNWNARPQPAMRSAAAPQWNPGRTASPRSDFTPRSMPHYSSSPRPVSAPHFDAGRSMRSAPSFHSGGGGSFHGAGGSFHGGGGGHGHR
jgi:hypothetical protein